MTKTLYLMRHGQTLFNKRHRIQGWCDAPLTDLGVYQAQVAGQYLKMQELRLMRLTAQHLSELAIL